MLKSTYVKQHSNTRHFVKKGDQLWYSKRKNGVLPVTLIQDLPVDYDDHPVSVLVHTEQYGNFKAQPQNLYRKQHDANSAVRAHQLQQSFEAQLSDFTERLTESQLLFVEQIAGSRGDLITAYHDYLKMIGLCC